MNFEQNNTGARSRKETFPPILDFTPGPRLDDAIRRCADYAVAAGFAEMLRAAAAGRIGLTAIMDRRAIWTPRRLRSSLPTVLLIGDDAGDSRDPDQWRSAISAIAWARCAIVHGTGAQAFHYREAVHAAERWGRVLFVETDSAHVGAWLAALSPRRIPVLSIIPKPGTGPHPVAEAGV